MGAATSTMGIVDAIQGSGPFRTFAAAITAAGVADELSGPGPFTVFAPTDDAFARLGDQTLDTMLADQPRLRRVVLYHVVAGRLPLEEAESRSTLVTLESHDLPIDQATGDVGGARVVAPDIPAANGIVHGIDRVLAPPSPWTR